MSRITSILLMMGLINWTGLFGQNKQYAGSSETKWTDVSNKIYPILKPSIPETETSQVIILKENEKPIIDTFLADICIAYLIDHENYFTYINNGQLKNWNIDKANLRKVALINLDKLAKDLAQFHGDSSFAMIVLNGNIESSLMLSETFWPYVIEITKSKDLVIGIPTKDVLLVTHSGSKNGLDKLRQNVKQIFSKGDHPITKWTFRRVNDKWEKFEYIE
jgi:uncharacterized protein YtpQ (UPF0354 family)